jgi:hypothetical protein
VGRLLARPRTPLAAPAIAAAALVLDRLSPGWQCVVHSRVTSAKVWQQPLIPDDVNR